MPDNALSISTLRAAMNAMIENSHRPEPDPPLLLWLSPNERYWFAQFGFLIRLPDGRTVTTPECSWAGVAPAGIEICPRLPIKMRPC